MKQASRTAKRTLPLVRRVVTRIVAVLLLMSIAPLSLIAFAFWESHQSGLPGRRGGPQDAYRHVVASALLAYFVSPRAVEIATAFLERNQGGTHEAMDQKNNRIGAQLGERSRSLDLLRADARKLVAAGAVDATDKSQVTWLPRDRWNP